MVVRLGWYPWGVKQPGCHPKVPPFSLRLRNFPKVLDLLYETLGKTSPELIWTIGVQAWLWEKQDPSSRCIEERHGMIIIVIMMIVIMIMIMLIIIRIMMIITMIIVMIMIMMMIIMIMIIRMIITILIIRGSCFIYRAWSQKQGTPRTSGGKTP